MLELWELQADDFEILLQAFDDVTHGQVEDFDDVTNCQVEDFGDATLPSQCLL